MKICLFKTKLTPRGKQLINLLANGIRVCGDESFTISSIGNFPLLKQRRDKNTKNIINNIKQANAVVIFGGFPKFFNFKRYTEISFRSEIAHYAKKYGKKLLIIDTAFISDNMKFVSLGFSGIKNQGIYYNKNSPADRFEKLNAPLFPVSDNLNTANKILVFGQNKRGVSCQGIDTHKWHIETIKQLHNLTNKAIIFRRHPREKYTQPKKDFPSYVKFSTDTLDNDLKNTYAAISYSSNALCHSLRLGIHTFSLGENAITYDITNNDINKITTPIIYPEKEIRQFFYNLAYAEWSLDELKNGVAWQNFRQFVP